MVHVSPAVQGSGARAPVAASLGDLVAPATTVDQAGRPTYLPSLPDIGVGGDQPASQPASQHCCRPPSTGALPTLPHHVAIQSITTNLTATNNVARLEIASNYPPSTAATIQPYPASARSEPVVLGWQSARHNQHKPSARVSEGCEPLNCRILSPPPRAWLAAAVMEQLGRNNFIVMLWADRSASVPLCFARLTASAMPRCTRGHLDDVAPWSSASLCATSPPTSSTKAAAAAATVRFISAHAAALGIRGND
ncbi:hypothetical protein PMIN01_09546 [Paraphaeosphaeria minitans]|uniref:Uncharacterized protein n=1 Tax=Paraphaeosphaeria minitans TaxID=565426 RepID=A0A9P6GCN4_9PLEO|nr:hypothetical protein PMIN01_09546 [Paraphaeosphaeria minitans]